MLELKTIYDDLMDGTHNYTRFSKKIEKYIDETVKEMQNAGLDDSRAYAVLRRYSLGYDEFCERFFDFDSHSFRNKDFEEFIQEFCIRVDTIRQLVR